MRELVSMFAWPIAMILTAGAVVSAQQQPQTPRRVPQLTTEDVVRDKPTQVISEPATESKDSKAAAKPEADAAVDKGTRPAAASAEETTWRESVKHAREIAKNAERAAEEAELRVNDLRNQLGISGKTTAFRNQIAADLEEAGQIVKQRKLEARQAMDEVSALLEEGNNKGYKEEEGPKSVSSDGKPNEDYYRGRFAELSAALEDAERKVQLYGNRVREYNQRITSNSVSGDNFYLAQIKQDRDDAQHQLDEALAGREKAVKELDALKDQARAAGLPPGIFR